MISIWSVNVSLCDLCSTQSKDQLGEHEYSDREINSLFD